jgi:hypothetical protein
MPKSKAIVKRGQDKREKGGREGGEGLERGMDGTRASGDLFGFGRIQKD